MLKRILSKQNRALLYELVRTDFKLRYQGSMLGYTWSLLRPLLLFLILYIVFVKFIPLGKDIPHYPVYLLLGIVIWTFFIEMTSQSLGSIVGRGNLIRSIKLPLWIIVLSSSISALINLGLNLLVVSALMVFNHVGLSMTAFYFPLVIIEVYILSLGVSLLLAAAFVKFRDLNYIWEVILQALFYLTPIIYPITKIANVDIQKIILISPLAQSIQAARYSLISHDTVTTSKIFENGPYSLIPFLIIGVLFLTGITYFKRQSKYFAENI